MAASTPRLGLLLLGLLSLACFGGPFLIAGTCGGGTRPGWPPDRPVEWAVLIGTVATVVVLLGLCLNLARGQPRPGTETRPHDNPSPPAT